MIRQATSEDHAGILAIAEATGLFSAEELAGFGDMIAAHLGCDTDAGRGQDGDGAESANEGGGDDDENCWIVYDDGGLLGAAYYAPEPFADGVWNLYFIGVHPSAQGQGRGSSLVRHVEAALAARHGRLLLVETSGQESFERTRAFYRNNGYEEEARIRDYYKANDDKVIFRKVLQP